MFTRPSQLGWLATVLVVCLAGSVMAANLQTDLLAKPLNCPLTCPNGTDNGIYCVQIGGTFEGSTSPMTPKWACDMMPAILGVADRPVTQRDTAYTIQCPAKSHLISYGEMYKTTAYACYNDSRSSDSSSPAALSSSAPVASPALSTDSATTTNSAATEGAASPEVASSVAAPPSSSSSLLAEASDIVVLSPKNVSSQKTTTPPSSTSSAGYARMASVLALFAGLLAAIVF